MLELVEFAIDDTRYVVPIDRVLEITGRVRLTHLVVPVPHVAGVFGYHGDIAVAVDARARLGHPPRRARSDDHFVILRSSGRTAALVVDRVLGLRTLDEQTFVTPPVASAHVRGLVVLPDGVLLVDDLEAVLSLDERLVVEDAIESLPQT